MESWREWKSQNSRTFRPRICGLCSWPAKRECLSPKVFVTFSWRLFLRSNKTPMDLVKQVFGQLVDSRLPGFSFRVQWFLQPKCQRWWKKWWEKFSNNHEVKEVIQSLKKVWLSISAFFVWSLRLSSRGPDNQPLLSAVDSAKVAGVQDQGVDGWVNPSYMIWHCSSLFSSTMEKQVIFFWERVQDASFSLG